MPGCAGGRHSLGRPPVNGAVVAASVSSTSGNGSSNGVRFSAKYGASRTCSGGRTATKPSSTAVWAAMRVGGVASETQPMSSPCHSP